MGYYVSQHVFCVPARLLIASSQTTNPATDYMSNKAEKREDIESDWYRQSDFNVS